MKEQETRCKRCRHICIQSRSRVSQKPTVNSPTVYYVVVLATRSEAKEPHPFYDCSRRLLIHAADIACPCDRCCCSGCAGKHSIAVRRGNRRWKRPQLGSGNMAVSCMRSKNTQYIPCYRNNSVVVQLLWGRYHVPQNVFVVRWKINWKRPRIAEISPFTRKSGSRNQTPMWDFLAEPPK